MTSDGGLRPLFQKHLPLFDWQPVEVGGTGRGVPDVNYCFGGIEGWIENKFTDAIKVEVRPEQIGWIERRVRHGGRVFIAVRRKTPAGPRRGPARDELWLYPGSAVRQVWQWGLATSPGARLASYDGGPARWDWEAVGKILAGS